MSWYATGTVAVTAASGAIVGAGTNWVANVEAGDIFWGPDGRGYEVVAVNSNTSLTIGPIYAGATAGGQAYRIAPTQGRVVALTAGVNQLLTEFGGIRDGIGAGAFPDGSAATPALRFGADADTGLFRPGANVFAVATNGVERTRWDTNGNMGLGVSGPQVRFHAVADRSDGMTEIARFEVVNVAATDAARLAIWADPANNLVQLQSTGNQFGGFSFSSASNERMRIEPTGTVRPGVDNSQSLGAASFRWSAIYLGANPIVTCDIRFKAYRADPDPTAAERSAALRAVSELGFFQFDDAIADKGSDEARWHFGPRAQAVWAIFADEGLCDALVEDEATGDLLPPAGSIPPAFLCFDKWSEETAPVMEGWRPSSVLGPDGQPVMVRCEEGEEATSQRPTGETYVVRAAGNRFGIRIDQLHSLMIAALNAERVAQEARIAALEGGA